jgi:hypothetical protein
MRHWVNVPPARLQSLIVAVLGSDLLCVHNHLQVIRYRNRKHVGTIQIHLLARLLTFSHRFRALEIISMSREDETSQSRSFGDSLSILRTAPQNHTIINITPCHAQTRERRPTKLFLQHNQHMLHHSQELTYPGPSLITGWRVKRWYVTTPSTKVVSQTTKLKNEKACAALHCPQ